ncbi:putative multidrug efflux pump outer membrane protein [Sphingomonas changbaiensis NBRC 104936]|uniref:Putative multidrug efflux pump outer membrane protein n=1 Tax=Sphingomonas changbaiensis NBRC 104936 TaxID=1219043 RepID=A0A0E9ML38_9SPHN|nr:TolC family outer membrane protein [Sphingomonas changbaiensis]GAO38482.1 putative multidrug efflux pump outer membrane protein [Sphingomonas changbaiensis NBRC 104936]
MRLPTILIATTAALALAAPAAAETLQGALAKAYANNPTLTGTRAQERANDENVPIQRAAGLPNLSASGGYNENVLIPGAQFTSPVRSVNGSLTLSVPIYQGGAVRNSVRAADQRVLAGQENLRGTESSIFSQVVAAYNDVIRDSSVVELNRANVHQLEVNLQATRDRFEVGDLTRTDVAQSEARLSLAQGDQRTAESNYIASRERYIALVGDVPDNLQPPPPLPNLPATPEDAIAVAIRENPDLAAAERNREAAKYDVRVAEAGVAPKVSAFGQGGVTDYLGTLGGGFRQAQSNTTVGLQTTIPIFQGGRPAAQTRQAQARESQSLEQVIATERGVIQQVRSAFAAWKSSQEVIRSAETAVSANTLSLEGVRAENSVGNRTIIEILNAEQELLNAQVQLVTARRNAYVAAFTLLAAMGQAEARDLNLEGVTLYDPTANYRRVRHKIWDWSSDPEPKTIATRTVDTPSQSPETIVGPK